MAHDQRLYTAQPLDTGDTEREIPSSPGPAALLDNHEYNQYKYVTLHCINLVTTDLQKLHCHKPCVLNVQYLHTLTCNNAHSGGSVLSLQAQELLGSENRGSWTNFLWAVRR